MKNLIITSTLLTILLTIAGCEKDVTNVKLPKADQKLVVYCYLSPYDSLLRVDVFRSQTFFGKGKRNYVDLPINDASVELSSGGKTIKLEYDWSLERYLAPHNDDFRIVAGRTYELKVSDQGGLSCSAKTTVPSLLPVNFSAHLDSSEYEKDGYIEKKYRIISKWNDIPGATNFYRLHISYTQDYDFQDEYTYTLCTSLIADEGKDGQELDNTCYYYYSYFGDEPGAFSVNDSALLMTVDVAYYKFHESYFRYQGDDPFAEPVHIYTNIDGGLGCFGSFLLEKVPLK